MNAAQQPTLIRIPMRTLSRQTRYALEGVDDILVYKVAMTTRFRGVTRREGLLLHGHAGWGEAAPFWNYDDAESSRWLAAALESARRFPPVPRRKFVPVNVTIPVISPEEAYERVKASGGCATAKIKVAPLGGVRAALKVARKSGLGVVVSSALETSVGLSVGVAAAAAVPGVPRAAGLATASLLVGDVTQPLIPERGRLPVGRLEPDRELIDRTPVDGDLVSRWGMRLEGMAEHLGVGGR